MSYGHDTYDAGELERTLKNTFNVIWQTISHSEFWQVVLKITLTLIFIIIAVKLWRFFYLMILEMRFAAALRRVADSKGWEFKRLHLPIMAFFRSYEGADILLKSKRSKLCIKYLPYQPVKKNVHLEGRDRITFSKPWALLYKVNTYGMPGNPNAHNATLFTRTRRANLSFGDTDGRKVWLIPKKSFRLTCVGKGGNAMDVIGNGYEWLEGEIFYEARVVMKYLDDLMHE